MQTTRHIVAKANALVEATYRLTLAEQRLLLLVISRIDGREDLADPTFVVTAAEFADVFGLNGKEGYATLRDAAERLFNRAVIIDRPDPDNPSVTRTKTRWVSAIDYLPHDGRLVLTLAQKILPYLTLLAREFTTYRLHCVSQMRSIHAIRLYETVIQWRGAGILEIDVAALKARFGVEKHYPRLGDFKRHVLTPAVDQINAYSDIQVTWKQRKAGRTVVALTFTFSPKAPTKSPAKKTIVDQRGWIEKNARPGESWEQARDRYLKESKL